jgi:hypothetical protein
MAANRDRFGRILAPMPSPPLPSPSQVYRPNTVLTLEQEESDVSGPHDVVYVKINHDLGLWLNQVTRPIAGRVIEGPKEIQHKDVVALMFDPLWVPLETLPLVWGKLCL